MKQITELKLNIRDSKEIRQITEDIMQFIFTKSQENLVEPMEWGDDEYPSDRRPSVISDESTLLLSGVPPYWENQKTMALRYDAPYAVWVEHGTPPHAVGARRLIGWVNRKLNIKGKKGLSVAYAIATKIRKEGMDPHPFIRPSVDAAVKKYKLKQIGGL